MAVALEMYGRKTYKSYVYNRFQFVKPFGLNAFCKNISTAFVVMYMFCPWH